MIKVVNVLDGVVVCCILIKENPGLDWKEPPNHSKCVKYCFIILNNSDIQ